MIKLTIMLLLSTTAIARTADLDFIEGKLTQIVDAGNGQCGQEGFIIIKTKTSHRFIYEYRKFNPKYYERLLGINIRVWYVESISRELDCNAGILDVGVLK